MAQLCGGCGSAIDAGDAFCGQPIISISIEPWTWPDPVGPAGVQVTSVREEYTGRGSDVYQTLRFESARATALQSAVQEGTASATAELSRQNPQPAGPASVSGLDID